MVFTLVLFLAVVVFLAFFIGYNLNNVCAFWFFKDYSDLPVAVLVLISFGAGIVFSLLCVMLSKFKRALYSDDEKTAKIKASKKSDKKEKVEQAMNAEKTAERQKSEAFREKINRKLRKLKKSKPADSLASGSGENSEVK